MRRSGVRFPEAAPFFPLQSMRSLFSITALLLVIMLAACAEQKKEYLPGELEFDKSVEAAEHTLKTIMDTAAEASQYCADVQRHYDQGVAAFQRLMLSIRGLALQKRDARLGVIREFIEQNCGG